MLNLNTASDVINTTSHDFIDNRHEDYLFEMAMIDIVWPDLIALATVGGDFNYDEDIQSLLCSASKLPWEKIEIIIMALCEKEYFCFLKQLVKLIFVRLDVMSRNDFLDPAFIYKVRKRIILGKNNKESKKIVSVACDLVSGMFACNCNGLSSLGSISKSEVKTMVIYILAMNMILSMNMHQDRKYSGLDA